MPKTPEYENTFERTVREAQLIREYRNLMVEAYSLGEEIKDTLGIIPPRVILSHKDAVGHSGPSVTVALRVD